MREIARHYELDQRAQLGGVSLGGLEPKSAVVIAFWWLQWSHKWNLVKRSKGARRMPRRGQAKKDVASCEKSGGAARRQ